MLFKGARSHRGSLGRVALSGLFLQPFVWSLYKAEPVTCSYATRTGENVGKKCQTNAVQWIHLSVISSLLRVIYWA